MSRLLNALFFLQLVLFLLFALALAQEPRYIAQPGYVKPCNGRGRDVIFIRGRRMFACRDARGRFSDIVDPARSARDELRVQHSPTADRILCPGVGMENTGCVYRKSPGFSDAYCGLYAQADWVKEIFNDEQSARLLNDRMDAAVHGKAGSGCCIRGTRSGSEIWCARNQVSSA